MDQDKSFGIWRILVPVFIFSFALDCALTWYVVGVMHFPISSDRDSFEYVGITDNLLAGHGFAVEPQAPWRPDGSRTPGMLLLNLPLRVLFQQSDLYAALAGRLMLALVSLLTGILGKRILGNAFGWFAGCILLLIPSIVYYTINPYETELQYLLALCLLFLGISIAWTHRAAGLLVAGAAAAFAMFLRPAALFVLLTVILACLLSIIFIANRRNKLTILLLAVGIALGTMFAYGSWSARNYLVFGAFEFSTVGGYNLLHYNAAGMRPYLDGAGVREINAVLVANPEILQRSYGGDQFAIASVQGKAGLDLIKKYPLAFARSQIEGSLRAFLIFDVSVLRNRFGIVAVYFFTVLQLLFTLGGLVGVWQIWSRADETVRALLAIMLISGVVSVLTSGALASPRFRFPLEILLALGWAQILMQMLGVSVGKKSFAQV